MKFPQDTDFGAGTAVLSTAVIARSSSAPRLMTYESEDFSVGGKQINCSRQKMFLFRNQKVLATSPIT